MYATVDHMRARWGDRLLAQLVDADAWGDAAADAVAVALTDTATLIDGYVAKFYAKAAGTPVPALLVRINCQLAYGELGTTPSDDQKDVKAEALRMLRDISTGAVKLDEGDPTALQARPGAVLVPDTPRVFSRDTLGGF